MSEATATPSPSLPRTPRLRWLLVISAGLVALAMWWLAARSPEGAALGELPVAERRALYERTLQTLQTTCAQPSRPSGLDHFCAEQAELIVQFKECDAECQRLVDTQRMAPTR